VIYDLFFIGTNNFIIFKSPASTFTSASIGSVARITYGTAILALHESRTQSSLGPDRVARMKRLIN